MKDRPDIAVHETQLSRDLREFDITMIGVGAMIGAGIFVLTGIAAGTAGPALMLSFALNGVVTIFTAMVYAELGSAIPEAGGGYLWVKEALGRSNGFLAGWMSWFSHAVAGSLYALGFGAYFGLLLEEGFGLHIPGLSGPFLEKALAVLIALVFLYINYRGASEMGLAGNIVTLGKLLTIGLFVIFGFIRMVGIENVVDKFTPFFPEGYGAVFVAMGITFIAFEGYEIIVQAGEEVQNPRRSIPRAVFWSLIIVVPIYVLVAIVSVGAIQSPEAGQTTWQFLGLHKELGLVEAARQFMPLGTLILLFGGLLSTISALNATTYSSTRVAFAMGRDNVLPKAFARVHPVRKTPYFSLIVTGAIIIFMIIAIPIEDVAAAADVMFLLLFLQVNYAVIRIREEFGDRLNYGYLMPFYPYVPIIGIVTKAFLAVYLYRFSPTAWYSAGLWILAGLAIFFVWSRSRLEEAERPRIAYEEKEGIRKGARLLVPVADPTHVGTEMAIATALARDQEADLVALNVVRVPSQLPLSEGVKFVDSAQDVLKAVDDFEQQTGGRAIHKVVAVGHQISDVIHRTARAEEASLIVLGWKGRVHEARIHGSVADAVLHNPPADIVMVKDNGLPEKVQSVGVGVSPGLHAQKALRTAISLARGFDAKLRVFSLRLEEHGNGELDKWFEGIREFCLEQGIAAEKLDADIVSAEDLMPGLVNEATKVDLFVVGASRDWVVKRQLFGNIPDTLANKVDRTSIVMVKERETTARSLLRRVWKAVGGR